MNKNKHPTNDQTHRMKLLKALLRGRKLTGFDVIHITKSPNGGRRLRDLTDELAGYCIPVQAERYLDGSTALRHYIPAKYRPLAKKIMGLP